MNSTFTSSYNMEQIKADTAAVDHKDLARRWKVLNYLAKRRLRWLFKEYSAESGTV